MKHFLPIFASLAAATLAAALAEPRAVAAYHETQLPLVIWHGLGDDFEREGLQEIATLASKVNPGTYVHLIRLADTGNGDRQATFLGNVTEQLNIVCEKLAADPILGSAPAVNALGFSQGGQFLRGYVERCNAPRVHNLVTFGSQHNGISEFQSCSISDWVCRGAEALLRTGRWTEFVQSRLVPAQYFRDPAKLDAYLEHSNYLADINNERAHKNTTYAANMATLNRFAMFMFEKDTIAVPKESAWFADVNSTDGTVTPLRERSIYKEDWLGLKKLGDQNKLEFRTVPGQHMHLSEKVMEETFKEYFGPTGPSLSSPPRLIEQAGAH
jgi:palmitoyl-protein thioesterase